MHSGAIHVVRIRGDGREADAAPPSGESRSEGDARPRYRGACLLLFVFYNGHSLCFKRGWRGGCIVIHAKTGWMEEKRRDVMSWHGLVLEPEPEPSASE